MAEVYEVEDVTLGSHYALKIFTYARSEVAAVKTRFFAEGRLLAKLGHPRLVRVYDVGEDDVTGRPYFVMDIVLSPDGRPKTLADVDVGSVDEDQVAIWYDDLREGLSYIHARGILHRDLKLQNVMIGPDGHAVLSDFGLAKVFDPELRTGVGLSLEQTLTAVKDGKKMVMGSVGYMAPEVEMGLSASKESDWYALGVIIFRLLTGLWHDARTDVPSVLGAYNPIWRDVLPKLLHSNPAGRECIDRRALEKVRREEEECRIDMELARLRKRRREAVRGRRNGWVAATLFALAFAVVAVFSVTCLSGRNLDFDSVVRIPPDAPDAEPEDDGALPSYGQFAMARIDAWVLTHDIFASLKSGGITREKAAAELRRLARRVEEDDLYLFAANNSSYVQVGDSVPLAFLLHSAASNLVGGAKE
jgi:serine/threonine protein kinase